MTLRQPTQSSSTGAPSRRPRIAIIGAGPGGICMAIKLREAGFEDIVILEREAEVGGTWVNNRYPGLACDVPSALYSFSFELKPDWTRAFALQPEIKAYMQHCAAKHGVMPHVQLGTEVQQARWDEAACQWHLATRAGDTVVADVLVSALGMFNELQWPDIAGLADFGGEVIHTGRWPAGTDLRGRRVAVIGTAGSAVQLIPEVARQAAHLAVFQRTPAWVMPKKDRTYTEDELAAFRRDPSVAQRTRQEYLAVFETRLTFDQPDVLDDMRRSAHENRAVVADPATREKLAPGVPLGSQRPLYSNEYYPTFNLPHVALVTEAIERITPQGVQTRDGAMHAADTLVLATGYAANKFLSVIDVTGRGGLTLDEAWRDGAQAYLGITTAGFPNLFMLYGPNTNNGSILTMIEHQADYVVARLRDMQQHRLAWIDVRHDAMDHYNVELQKAIQAVEPWRAIGTRYYRGATGRIVTQWPDNMAAYEALTRAGSLDAFHTHPAEAPTAAGPRSHHE